MKSTFGLVTGIDGEIVQLSKFKRNWHKMFEEHNINLKYKNLSNFEHFCYLHYMGMDAEAIFVDEIRKQETKQLS